MTKLQKLEREAQRVRDKIEELQESLVQIDKQKVELENAHIIQMVRASKVTPDELYKLLTNGIVPSVIDDKASESEVTQNES